jgi:uncharacterized tellurite resistance protein B-like protein
MPLSQGAVLAIRRAMALAMTVDGQITDAEIDVLKKEWKRLAGVPLDAEGLAGDVDQAVTDADTLWTWMKANGPGLVADEKEIVVRGAILVVMADGELAEQEMILLRRLARALDFADLRRVMNEVWHESRRAS